jgi:hypothetical protein
MNRAVAPRRRTRRLPIKIKGRTRSVRVHADGAQKGLVQRAVRCISIFPSLLTLKLDTPPGGIYLI